MITNMHVALKKQAIRLNTLYTGLFVSMTERAENRNNKVKILTIKLVKIIYMDLILTPYRLRLFFLLVTPLRSIFPLTAVVDTPIKSLILAP